MTSLNPKFIVDNSGRKTSVIISMNEFDKIIEELEELDDLRAFDKAVAENDESTPIDIAFREIEEKKHQINQHDS